MRRAAALQSLLALGAAAAFPRPANAYEPHVLRFTDGLDVTSLNPFLAVAGNTRVLSELTMAHTVRYGPRGEPIPELITEIPTLRNGAISRDGKTITFHLRRGVRWSDGVPFDASDVLYSVDVAMDSRNNLFVHDPWEHLAGASASGKYTVRLHLKEQYQPFLYDYFSVLSNACILPKHILGSSTVINTVPYNGQPVGIGPFRYTSYQRSASVEMERNPYYWRGTSKLRKIVYKIIPDQNTMLTQLETGEIDLWDTINGPMAVTAKALPGKRWTTRLSNFMGGIYLNTSRPQLSDPVVRQALRLAVDRTSIFEKVMQRNGAMTESYIPQVSPDYVALPLSPYDPPAAQRMLDEAGWKLGDDGTRRKGDVALALDLAIPSGYQPSEVFASLLKQDWAAIGVRVTIHVWPTAQFFATYSANGALERGNYDIALLSQAQRLLSAAINGVFDCASVPPHGANFVRYCNPRVDALNDRYLHTYDPKVQKALATEMQRLIDSDCPVIEIYERAFLAVYDARLKGYTPHPFSDWGDPLALDI